MTLQPDTLTLSGAAPAYAPPAPDPAHITPGLDDAIDADLARLRAQFLAPLADAPLDVLVTAIRQACARGYGFWQDPSPPNRAGRPATHLFEISFLGLPGVGACPLSAARAWRIAALALAAPEADPEKETE